MAENTVTLRANASASKQQDTVVAHLDKPSCASKFLATVAFSFWAVLCAPAATADANQKFAEAQAACTAETQLKTQSLRNLIVKREDEGDTASVTLLKEKLAEKEKSLTEVCIQSAKADDRIAKAVAQNAKLDSEIAEIRELRTIVENMNAATRQKIAFLNSFTSTDPESIKKYNEMIANIPKETEATLAYVAKARKYATNKAGMDSLDKIQKDALEIREKYASKTPLDARR